MQVEAAALTWQKTGDRSDVMYWNSFGPVTTVMMIDPWQKPTSAFPLSTLLGLTHNQFYVSHSATGNSSDGNVPARVSLSGSKIMVEGTNSARWQAAIVPDRGTFTGSFDFMDDGIRRPVRFSGILRQPANTMDSLIGNGSHIVPVIWGAPGKKVAGEVLFQR